MHWDILLKKLTKPIKLSKKWKEDIQARFMLQLSHLLQEGFSLDESLKFLEYLFDAQKSQIEQMRKLLSEGHRFDQCLREVGFSETHTSQIYLSMQFGSFEKACDSIGDFLIRKLKQKKKMHQTMIYPAFLFIFVIGMILCIRVLLLDQLGSMIQEEQLKQSGFLYWIWLGFQNLPQISLVILGVGMILSFLIYSFWKQKDSYHQFLSLIHFPIVGQSVQHYVTFLYAREFSYFLGNGQSLLTMVTEMKKDGTSNLSKILAEKIEQELVRGESFSGALEKIGLFRKEFIWLVLEGEKTRQLDVQLKVYADQMLEEFSKGIEKKIKWIQPILLMGIGFLIVSMYLILLLPTLTMIGGN